MSEKLLKFCNKLRSHLIGDRTSWEADWMQLSKHFQPRKCRIIDKQGVDATNRGGINSTLLDSTGVYALRDLGAGMHGGMTSPARPWFSLALLDDEQAKEKQNREWLDIVCRRMRNVINRSSFYEMMNSIYSEAGGFGTGFTFVLPDELDPERINFIPLTVGEYAIGMSTPTRVDIVVRTMHLTAWQMVEMFGEENLSEAVQQALKEDENSLKRFPVYHLIYPRRKGGYDPKKLDAKNKPFASVYWEPGETKKVLRESGYDMFPGLCVRWDVTGQDVYGRCPAMDALPDVRMLQAMKASVLKGQQKLVDPPTVVPEGMKHPDLYPNGIIPVSGGAGGTGQAVYAAYQITPDIRGGLAFIEDTRKQIREGMYNDLFTMISQAPARNMTATQVAEMQEEKLIMLGSVIERFHAEFFIPLINLLLHYMMQAEMLPPVPERLQNAEVKVEFLSLLAQAQKQLGTASIEKYTIFVGSNAELFPELRDTVDVDKLGNIYADMSGVPAEIITSQEERDKTREARAEKQQQMEMAEQAQQMAGAASAAGSVPLDGGNTNLVEELLKGIGRVPNETGEVA